MLSVRLINPNKLASPLVLKVGKGSVKLSLSLGGIQTYKYRASALSPIFLPLGPFFFFALGTMRCW